MSKKIQRALTSHPSRGLGSNLIVTCKGDTVEVYVEGGSRLAVLPANRMRGPHSRKAERVSRLLGDLEEAEAQAKAAAARAAAKGFGYRAIYSSSKASLLRSKGWPREATQWAESVVAMAVQLEASRAGRPAR